MDNQIICPNCKKNIQLSDAFVHDLREKLRAQAKEYALKKDAEYKQKIDEIAQQYEKEKRSIEKALEEKLKQKLENDLKLKIEDSKNEADEVKKNNHILQQQLLELTKSLRQLKTENEQKELELAQKLLQEQEKIRDHEKKRLNEEYRLKQLEYEKKIADATKANDDLRRKLEQGSQQTQGEVLELELEHILRTEFPIDHIIPVAKGIRGGDIIQQVQNQAGKLCGTIIWETKRTKSWSAEWIKKLREDQRTLKAEVAVLISEALPPTLQNFGYHEGIWVGNFDCVIGLAHILRRNLLEVALIKSSSEGKKEKMEILYNYIYGTEFRQRIEAVMEAFSSLQSDIEKEKRWFTAKWAKQEKDIRKVLDNTLGLSGDLQSITGKELPDVDTNEMLADGN